VPRAALAAVVALLAVRCGGAATFHDAAAGGHEASVPVLPVKVLAAYPHDPRAFTQGLLYLDGRLYESLGGYGTSALREVEIASGRVLRETRLPRTDFGEGLAAAGERLVQLTWREGRVRLWRRTDFELLGELRLEGEGWGLAFDGERLVMSDGTAWLQWRALDDFRLLERIEVRREGRPVAYLNELEWVEGWLYANVWQSDEILRIDPRDGRVVAVYDARGLLTDPERARADVLNGIAWNPERRVFYLTGKLWPRLFEVELPAP
jgi:glutaminyl-peptide cyclotransferase